MSGKTLLASTLKHFNYAECVDCHQILDVTGSTENDLRQWKFSLFGLRPSILRVAKGLCGACQKLRQQFHGVLSQ